MRETLESRAAARFAPSERFGLFAELWSRVDQAERRATRRRRAAAIAGVAAAIAAATAAGVLAFGGNVATHTVDQTFVCTSNDVGGVNEFEIFVGAGHGFAGAAVASGAFVLAPNKLPESGASNLDDGRIHADASACRRVGRATPLARRALALKERTVDASDKLECWVSEAYVRERVTFDRTSRPIRTLFAMENAKTHAPLAFVDAAGRRLTVYAAPACLHGQ